MSIPHVTAEQRMREHAEILAAIVSDEEIRAMKYKAIRDRERTW